MFCLFTAIKAERKESRCVPAGSSVELQMLDLSSETEYKWEQRVKNLRVSNSEAAAAVWENN